MFWLKLPKMVLFQGRNQKSDWGGGALHGQLPKGIQNRVHGTFTQAKIHASSSKWLFLQKKHILIGFHKTYVYKANTFFLGLSSGGYRGVPGYCKPYPFIPYTLSHILPLSHTLPMSKTNQASPTSIPQLDGVA